MVIHLVLFRPKANLSGADERALLASIEQAAATIPSVRRFRIGRTLPDAPAYQLQGFPDMPYVAIVELDSREGLENYLEHHAHGELGRRFNESLEAALIYDYDVDDVPGLGAGPGAGAGTASESESGEGPPVQGS